MRAPGLAAGRATRRVTPEASRRKESRPVRIMTMLRAALIAAGLFAISLSADAHWDVGISVGFAPPALPVYEQPPCPAVGYLWTPGYWAYDEEADGGYYWVPGTWVLAPRPGLLWTPGYWGAEGAQFAWHGGYWDTEIGFYGGINYGFGYFGVGFAGGYWRDRDFFYNRAVANVTNVSVTNVYNTTVVNNYGIRSRVSYNGGSEGARMRPNGAELAVAQHPHIGATSEQLSHERGARSVPALRAAVNHGVPPIAATPRPAAFEGHDRPVQRGAQGTAPARSARAIGNRTDTATSLAGGHASGAGAPIVAGRTGAPAVRSGGNAPRSDRPPWANRQPALASSAAQSPRPDAYRYGTGARGGTPAPSYQSTAVAPRRDVPRPSPVTRPSDTNQAMRASTPRYTQPARPAPDYRVATREPARPSYAQRASVAPREGARPPSPSSPRPVSQPAPMRPQNAPHPSGQKFNENHGSRQS